MNEFQRYSDLLWLRKYGRAVEFPPAAIGQKVRLTAEPSCLGTNIFPAANRTVIAFCLSIRASATVIPHGFFFIDYCLGKTWFLPPSEDHEGDYCVPPGIWISRSLVLNRALRGGREYELQRNCHWKGWVLLVADGTVPVSAGEEIEAVCGLEDLRGHQYVLPLTLVNRPLSPEVLRRYGGERVSPQR